MVARYLHSQLQKVSGQLDKHVEGFRSLVSHFRPCKYSFFCPGFLTFFTPSFWPCSLPPTTFYYTLSCQKVCLPSKSGVLIALLISFPLLSLSLSCLPGKTQFFLLKLQTCSVCPSFPLLPVYISLQDLTLVWLVLFLHFSLSKQS